SVEVLHLLRVLAGGERDEVYLPLHHGTDGQSGAQRDLQIGFCGGFEARHVPPETAYSSSAWITGECFDHAAGDDKTDGRKQHQYSDRNSHVSVYRPSGLAY